MANDFILQQDNGSILITETMKEMQAETTPQE